MVEEEMSRVKIFFNSESRYLCPYLTSHKKIIKHSENIETVTTHTHTHAQSTLSWTHTHFNKQKTNSELAHRFVLFQRINE